MVETALHKRRMNDMAFQRSKISPEMAGRRAAHLSRLGSIEELVREHCPLPITYDVTRMLPPFFAEFTFTELLGGLWINPQSSEIAARLVAAAVDDFSEPDFNVAGVIPLRDKYTLAGATERPRRVVFMPGDNMVDSAVSPDYLLRVMHEHPDAVIKPHPMTSGQMVRRYGIRFGYQRVLDPMTSGAALIPGLEAAYLAPTSELGLYAVLSDVPIFNIARFNYEPRAAFSPFYRLLWNLPPAEARARLIRALNSPLSGFLHPDQPDIEARVRRYFENAMQVREFFRPLMQELAPDQFREALLRAAPHGPAKSAPRPAPAKPAFVAPPPGPPVNGELVSPDYLAQLRQMHASRPWGETGARYAADVGSFADEVSAESILDYGCGRGTLGRALQTRSVSGYDPGIPELAAEPAMADLVVSTDVLEHVEPEKVDAVLGHIFALSRRATYLAIATGPARAILPDGRNAHLVVEPAAWWREKLLGLGWSIAREEDGRGEVRFWLLKEAN